MDIATKTFYVIDFVESKQNILIYKINEDQYPINKIFTPIRQIYKSFWNLSSDILMKFQGYQNIVIEATRKGIFELYFKNIIDSTYTLALFDSNLVSDVSRVIKLGKTVPQLFLTKGQSNKERFSSYYYKSKPGTISVILTWPSIKFSI